MVEQLMIFFRAASRAGATDVAGLGIVLPSIGNDARRLSNAAETRTIKGDRRTRSASDNAAEAPNGRLPRTPAKRGGSGRRNELEWF